MGAPTIRGARRGEAGAVEALTREAYAKWVAVAGREPKPMFADHARAVALGRVHLLFADGVLAGLVEAVDEPGALLIENLAVSPRHQRRGFGRALLAHVEELAAEAGRARVRLYTNKLFAENVTFYARAGYAVEREEAGPRGVAVHMGKRIAPRSG